jgi:hypothetical protein
MAGKETLGRHAKRGGRRATPAPEC